MNISNWITFEPNAKASDKTDEIESIAQTRLARDIQERLRNQIDPGIDIRSARRAQAIRVQAEGGQIVIDEDDQAKLFAGGVAEEENDAEPPASSLDDLFRPGSGVPEAQTQQDGSTQLVFRSIKASDLFNQQIAGRRSEMVEHVIADVLQTGVVDAVENGIQEVDRLYPELDKK